MASQFVESLEPTDHLLTVLEERNMLSSAIFRRAVPMPRCWSALLPNGLTTTTSTTTTTTRYLASSSSSNMDLLKKLRHQTGAPVVDCKKALAATSNEVSAAVDWLREHGVAKVSAKVAGRATTEGLVALHVSATGATAALVRVASETDFASRSPNFVRLIQAVAAATLQEGEVAAIQNETVKAELDDAMVAIRENLSIAKAVQWQVSSNDGCMLVGYVHNKVDSAMSDKAAVGMSAALVEVHGLNQPNAEAMQAVGKRLAMHIVAARPTYCTPEDVPQEEVEKERAILTKQVADSGKPHDIVAKMVEGRLRKFYEAVCLTEQEHMIEEGNPKIGSYLEKQGMTVKRFELESIR